MGIDPADLTDRQKELMTPVDRKKLGRRGLTAKEALHVETTRYERKIHSQIISFCRRNGIDYWHSDPTRKSSIGAGLPDFLFVKYSWALAIEFKVPPNKLSKLQEDKISELRSHGTTVHIVEETRAGAAYTLATKLLSEFFNLQIN